MATLGVSTYNVTMNRTQLLEFLSRVSNTQSILLEAHHGIGKTAIIQQFADSKGLPLIDIRLGQKEVGDISGFPYEENGVMKHAIPEVLVPIFEKPCVVFFDEWDRASKDVHQCVMQILLERKYDVRALHPDCYVFCAGNGDTDVYSVTDIDPAIRSRLACIKYEPTWLEWSQWAEGKIDPSIIYMLSFDKTMLDPPKSNADTIINWSVAHPSRRGWTMFSNFLVENKDMSTASLRTICASYVGIKAAEFFKVSYENYLQIATRRKMDSATKVDDIPALVYRNYLESDLWVDINNVVGTIKALDLENQQKLVTLVAKYCEGYKKSSVKLTGKLNVVFTGLANEMGSKLFNLLSVGLRESLLSQNSSFYSKFI